MFSTPFCKIRSRNPGELKLSGLIAYIMFYKIWQFENLTITNDVIMTSLQKQWQNSDLRETKQIIYHSKGIDESYPKMFLLNIEFGTVCQKLWALLSNFGSFYDVH